jgi:two-component system nitrogen regulation sensor histidine kinase NtrY
LKAFPIYKRYFSKRILLYAAGVLLALSFLSAMYFQTKPSILVEKGSLENYIQRQQKDFNKLISDTALMRRLVQQNETLDQFRSVAQKRYGVFLVAETVSGPHEILFWNNQRILPPLADFSRGDGEYFDQLENGYYVIEKRTIRLSGLSSNVIAYAMILVMVQPEIETNYFYTHFEHSRDALKKIAISGSATPFVVRSVQGKPLFFIERRARSLMPENDTVTVVLRLAAFVLLLLYIHFVAASLTRRQGIVRGVGFLIFLLIIVRALSYLLPTVFYFRQFHMFDPSIYAANWLNRSLGDLLFNSILFCWVVVFTWFNIGPNQRLPRFLLGKRYRMLAAGVIAMFMLVYTTFFLADVVRSLVADSKISFNVTDFFSLSFFTVVGLVVLALLSLAYYYFTRLLFRFIFPGFSHSKVAVYFVLALTGLLFLTFRASNTAILFHLPILVWLMVYTLFLNQEQFVINRFRITVAGLLFWISLFSVSLAALILKENASKEWVIRKGIAEKHDELTDPSSEHTLSIGLRYLDNRFLAENYKRFVNPIQNQYLRDSIIKENISSGYINKYNSKIYVFDAANRSVNNLDPTTYAELNNIFTVQSQPTGIPDLYYHETAFDRFTYITRRLIADSLRTYGTFFIISTPKKYNTDALYPELLRNISRGEGETSPVYFTAVYNNNLLISAANKYPFRISLTSHDLPKGEIERRINGDYDELWYKASSKKVVVVAKQRDSLIESITLFSYLFCAFLTMIALLEVLALILKASNDRKVLQAFWQLNIRSQVHGTIIFVSVLSFLIIGVATISFFIDRYNRNNIDKLSRTASIMVKEMQKRLVNHKMFDDVIKMYDSVANYELQVLIDEVADIHNVDVNVYDLNGDLQVSSETEVYSTGILSTKMHPEAYYHLNRMRQVQYVQEETMSSLNYLSIYAAVRNEDGSIYAYLNIPYFLSQVDLNQEISNFLVTIINLNAFIFLISGTIALFITNKITRSFSVIGDKMKAITLGKNNEEIVWNRNDEIGELVKQYNKMVRQLEQSAGALAKSEREGAWREMARQVAHEIKNPLTPMKLSIQYLQKAINNNQQNVKQLTANVANTLVEQIDHLSKIAADFARFANIGNTHIEVFDLHNVLENLTDLFQANPNVAFSWNKVDEEIVVKADKTHMNRLFTNLLTNAIEACNGNGQCHIEIEENLLVDNVIIEIRDNGEGIAPEMQPKIFTPNFTTKTSGTGLGLAMCKSIIEQTGGDIWFETEQGRGTTFFVSIPVID